MYSVPVGQQLSSQQIYCCDTSTRSLGTKTVVKYFRGCLECISLQMCLSFIPFLTNESPDTILENGIWTGGQCFANISTLLCLSVCYVTSGENRSLSWNQAEQSTIVNLQIIHGWRVRTSTYPPLQPQMHVSWKLDLPYFNVCVCELMKWFVPFSAFSHPIRNTVVEKTGLYCLWFLWVNKLAYLFSVNYLSGLSFYTNQATTVVLT